MSNNYNEIKIPLHQAKEIIIANAEQQLKNPYQSAVINLQGPPGIGKTAILKAIAVEQGWQFKHDNLGVISFEKVSGIPDIDDNMEKAKKLRETAALLEELGDKEKAEELRKKAINLLASPEEKSTNWSRPELIDFSNYNTDTPILWLLDDWHLANPNVQAMAFELFTERKLQNHRIPENVIIVLAQNDSAEAGFKKSLSPVINRSMILKVYMDYQYWYESFGKDHVHPAITTFLKEYPSAYQEPENAKEPFGTFRSWTNFSPILESLEKQFNGNIPTNILMAAVNGIASRKSAAEFISYYEVFSKFDTEAILLKGEMPQLNDRIEVFACSMAVAAKYSNIESSAPKNKLKTVQENLFKFIFRLNDVSVVAMLLTDLKLRKGPKYIGKLMNAMKTYCNKSKDTKCKELIARSIEIIIKSKEA